MKLISILKRRAKIFLSQLMYRPHKIGLNTKLHLAVDSNGMPVRVIITKGTTVDCI